MKKIIILLSLFSLNSFALDLELRAGAGLGFSDWNTSQENHNNSNLYFGGLKVGTQKNKWDYSLAVDVLKYTIKNDINYANVPWNKAKHENENVLLTISPKYILNDHIKIGPYLGHYMEENITTVTKHAQDVLGLEMDYDFNEKWGMSAGVEQNFDSGAKHRVAKLTISYNLFGEKAKPAMPISAAKDVCEEVGHTVYFAFDSSEISTEEMDSLKAYLENSQRAVNIIGHTDTIGTTKYNDALSERRAASVSKIAQEMGIKISIEAGEGEEHPISDTHKLNRRVEVIDCQ